MRMVAKLLVVASLCACLTTAPDVLFAAGPVSSTAAAPSLTEGTANSFSGDLSGNTRVSLGTYVSGENPTATGGGSSTGVMVTEQRYLLSSTVTSDTQIKGSAGFVKDVTCIGTDAAATAGSIILYNSLTEAAPAIWTWNVAAAAVLAPITFPIDFVASTGLYLGFTTTADVGCYVRYR